MYSKVAQDEVELDDKVSDEYTKLYHDHKTLERRFRRLRLSLVLCFILCLGLLVYAVGTSSLGAKVVTGSQKPSPVREMPAEVVTFNQADVFANHSNPSSDAAWAALMPEGDGFVIVKEPKKYNLPPGVASSQGQQYDITVFHQLHCLRYIRTFTYSILDLAQKGVDNEGERYFVDHPDDHIFHCFDYLRQGLMCNADMTFEAPKEEEDGSRFAVNGWGIAHQCKSWDAVMQYMEENRFHQPWELGPKRSLKSHRK